MEFEPPLTFTERIQDGERRFIVTYREYQLCEECKHFPSENFSGWKKNPPRCVLNMPMRFIEPQDVGEAESGNYGFIPLTFTCEEFERDEQD